MRVNIIPQLIQYEPEYQKDYSVLYLFASTCCYEETSVCADNIMMMFTLLKTGFVKSLLI